MRNINYMLIALMALMVGQAQGEIQPIVFSNPTYTGTGCPKGSVAFLATEDAFTLTFSNYTAELGASVYPKLKFRYCNIQLWVTAPTGFNAEVENIDYRGYTSVDNRTYSFVTSFFQLGSTQFGSSKAQFFKGPGEFDFFKTDKPYFTKKQSCSQERAIPLNIFNSLTVVGDKQRNAVMTLDSIDGVVQAKLRLKPCF